MLWSWGTGSLSWGSNPVGQRDHQRESHPQKCEGDPRQNPPPLSLTASGHPPGKLPAPFSGLSTPRWVPAAPAPGTQQASTRACPTNSDAQPSPCSPPRQGAQKGRPGAPKMSPSTFSLPGVQGETCAREPRRSASSLTRPPSSPTLPSSAPRCSFTYCSPRPLPCGVWGSGRR